MVRGRDLFLNGAGHSARLPRAAARESARKGLYVLTQAQRRPPTHSARLPRAAARAYARKGLYVLTQAQRRPTKRSAGLPCAADAPRATTGRSSRTASG